MNSNITSQLSSIEAANKLIRRNTKDFSFVDNAAKLAVNERFVSGYKQLLAGNDNGKTNIWKALSAVGNDTGQILYDAVLNYIDCTSNIDTCNVSALRSMLKAYGIDYNILDSLSNMPSEIK